MRRIGFGAGGARRAARVAGWLGLAAVAAGCSADPGAPDSTSQPPPLAPGPRRPDIVLVVLDTLRADHLPVYGYARPTAPSLDALAAESTVYENAHAASSWTLPSHASIFTGLYPIAHRTHHEHRMLDLSYETLAEVLQGSGYRTNAVVSNAMLARTRQLDQGFDHYLETWRGLFGKHPKLFPDLETKEAWQGVEDPTFRRAKKQLRPEADENSYFQFQRIVTDEPRKEDEPDFVFVNLVGVHSPYDSSGPFHDRFVRNPSPSLEENHWAEYYAGRIDFTQEQLDHLVDLYDAEILHVDYVVGRMIEDLKAAGRWENTLFVVTSDHGENLGDHGHVSHVFSLNETLTRVPLLVHYPPRFPAGVRIATPVLLIDLFPTLLAAAGMDRGHAVDGRLLPRRPDDAPPARPRFAEYYYPWENIRFMMKVFQGDVPGIARLERRLRSVTEGDLKLVWGSDGRNELYDLARDPGEDTNLIDDPSRAPERDALLRSLDAFVEEHGGRTPISRFDPAHPDRQPGEGGTLDPETVRQLEELGYL